MHVSNHAKERMQRRVRQCYWRKFAELVYKTMVKASRLQGDRDYAVCVKINNSSVGYAVCKGTQWITTLDHGKVPIVSNIYQEQA